MIRSMTAFARCEVQSELGHLIWEVKSVNHRYLDIALRLPEAIRPFETKVRELIGQSVKRGKIDATLKFRPPQDRAQPVQLRETAVKALFEACHTVEALAGERSLKPFNALDVLSFPGVLEESDETDSNALATISLSLLSETLDELQQSRRNEGIKLNTFISERLDQVEVFVDQAKTRLPEIRETQKQKLIARLAELNTEINQDRLEQELVYTAQKMDVDEEMDRLNAHISEVRSALKKKEPVGRRLDFLMQEMNREANTLSSKSIDKTTTAIAVDLKVLIEQMREQIQNIE